MFASLFFASLLAMQSPSVPSAAPRIPNVANVGFDRVLVIINADPPLRQKFAAALTEQFRAVPQVTLLMFDTAWPNEEPNWSLNIVITESSRDGKPDGGYVMATAFTDPISPLDREKVINDLSGLPCAPKEAIMKSVSARVIAAADLKGMLVSHGSIADGFSASAREIAETFQKEFLPFDLLELKRKGRPASGVPPMPEMPEMPVMPVKPKS